MKIKEVNIADINPGDTIYHDGKERIVCKKDITRDDFMGICIFGDSYHAGHKPVKKVIIQRVLPKLGSSPSL